MLIKSQQYTHTTVLPNVLFNVRTSLRVVAKSKNRVRECGRKTTPKNKERKTE
jgi:hypothetical protein